MVGSGVVVGSWVVARIPRFRGDGGLADSVHERTTCSCLYLGSATRAAQLTRACAALVEFVVGTALSLTVVVAATVEVFFVRHVQTTQTT